MNKITFFTVNAFNNDYFRNGKPSKIIEKISFDSWGKNYEVKVFDYNSDVVKDCINEYKDIYNFCQIHPHQKCIFADIVRLYVLTKYKYHFYFDCDLYLLQLNLRDLYHFQASNGFMAMYNGEDLETAKRLLQVYRTDNILKSKNEMFRDKDIIKKSGLHIPPIKDFKYLHLTGFDEEPHGQYKCYTNNPNELKELIDIYLKVRKAHIDKRLEVYTENQRLITYIPRMATNKKDTRQAIVLKPLNTIVSENDRNIILDKVKKHWAFLSL